MTVNYYIMSKTNTKNSLRKKRSSKTARALDEMLDLQNDPLFQQISTMNLQPLKDYEIPSLNNIIERFEKEIRSPIDLQTSIFNTKSLQRCLEHNNVSTLYCISDRRPLCVTCMYQNNIHKKHKVVPLNRANRDLEDEKNRNLLVLDHEINILDKLINQSHSNLSRAQKQFPDILNNLAEFYKEFQQLLTQKMNEQMKYIQIVWQKMRFEYSSFAQELSDIKIFVLEHMRDIKKREGEEYSLFNRNISHNLAKLQQIIEINVCAYHENNFMSEIKYFRQIQLEMGSKIVLKSPFKQKVKREVKTNFNYMNEASKRILQNQANMNQAAEAADAYKQKSIKDRSLSAKQQKALKDNIQIINKSSKKRLSLSPKPLRPIPAVSAHKPPVISQKGPKG